MPWMHLVTVQGALFEKLDSHWRIARCHAQKKVPENEVTRCEKYPAWLRTRLVSRICMHLCSVDSLTSDLHFAGSCRGLEACAVNRTTQC